MHTDASLRFERGVDPYGQARAVERATELLLEISGGNAGPLVHHVAEEHLPASEAIHCAVDVLHCYSASNSTTRSSSVFSSDLDWM